MDGNVEAGGGFIRRLQQNGSNVLVARTHAFDAQLTPAWAAGAAPQQAGGTCTGPRSTP